MPGHPMLPDLADGIYFDLPFEVYRALPRLSASGVQDMLVSPATFWASSWLNRAKAEQMAAASLATIIATAPVVRPAFFDALAADLTAAFPEAAKAARDEATTEALTLGRAYHAARLEPEHFHERFVRKPERGDYPVNSLWTGTDIEAQLAARDLPKTKAGEKVPEKAARLAAAGYEGVIFPLEMAKWEAERGTRVGIPAKTWDDLLLAMERVRESAVAKLLTGGVAEVSVLWTDGRGIRCKCRFDYLKPDSWTDFKTFDNSRGKVLEQALTDIFRFNRHYIQGAFYREATDLLREDALPIVSPSTELQRQVIGRIATSPAELECWFAYQEKGGVPNLLGRRMHFYETPPDIVQQNAQMRSAGWEEERLEAVAAATATMTFIYRRARGEIAQARDHFVNYSEIFEAGRPWQPWRALRSFDDTDFPDFWLRNE